MKTKINALCGMLVAALVLAGCTAPNTNAPANGDTVTVHMKDLKFSPEKLTIAAGTTVEWVNDDPFGHAVSPLDPAQWGTEGSGSDQKDWLQQGETWSGHRPRPP